LNHEGWPRLAAVALYCDDDDIPAPQDVQPSVSPRASTHAIASRSDRMTLFAARLWRRHSSAKPRALVSGSQTCTKRKPESLIRSR
jgi:hypothetical protein